MKRATKIADEVYTQVMDALRRERERSKRGPLFYVRRFVQFMARWFIFACGGGAMYMLGEGAWSRSWPEINAGAVLLFVFLYMVRRI